MIAIAKPSRTSICAMFALCFVCWSFVSAFGAGAVDLTFNAAASKDVPGSSQSGNLVLQPDGKIIVFGSFQVINGAARNGIARLNSDGSLDNSFNCSACNFVIISVAVQPNGKIVVAGRIDLAPKIIRLNQDGSFDDSFFSPFPATGAPRFAAVHAVQPDGKIYASETITVFGLRQTALYRLNPNGSIDGTFAMPIFSGGSQFITHLVLQPDGKLLISGAHSYGYLFRVNPDGSKDTTFESPSVTFSQTQIPANIGDFDFQSDGRVVFVGTFDKVNGISRNGIARLNTNGGLDMLFAPEPPSNPFFFNSFGELEVLSNDKILYTVGNAMMSSQILRLNPDGSPDNTFAQPANLIPENWVLDTAERIVLFGGFVENGENIYRYARLNQNGSLDTTFNVSFGMTAGSVLTFALQPNGKILLGGDYTHINGVLRRRLARINADGTTDASFNTDGGFNGVVNKITLQPDGKVLVGGSFSIFNTTSRPNMARLNSDGSLDNGFNPAPSGAVYAIAVLPDGKILVGGSFSDVGGNPRTGLARLTPEGVVDGTFDVTLGNNATVRNILVQPDGKILVGGAFNGVNGFNRTNLVRLNSDGSVDTSFNAGNLLSVGQIELQPDGKYLVLTGSTIARLNSNGTTDSSFQSPVVADGAILSFALQSDGNIVVGGNFLTINNVSRQRLARLRSNGTLDANYFPVGANNAIRVVLKQPDEKILVGGDFTNIANVARVGVARLINTPDAPSSVLFDFGGDGRADIALFRPSNNFWYRLDSANSQFIQNQFGTASDLIAPADYDGDGKTDLAYFRPAAPDVAAFYILDSSTNTQRQIIFAQAGDAPMSGDWDGDGKADVAVYREGIGGAQSYFFYRPSGTPGVNFRSIPWGITGDKPVRGDFDGDGKQDAAVFRPSSGAWFVLFSGNNQFFAIQWGAAGDIPTPADYDGDRKTDVSIFRPSIGSWFRINSSTNQYGSAQFGVAGDVPVAADYDGDGKADVAVWRPSTGIWYQLRSTGGFVGVQFGAQGDVPAESAFVR